MILLGPADAGKSSFIQALAEARPGAALIDLDPGQKMVGAPGTASLGSLVPEPRLEHFVFLGSTAVAGFGDLRSAALFLAARAGARPLLINTSGFVTGPGVRLQSLILDALKPDLVVAIGLAGPLAAAADLIIEPSVFATRKTEGVRRRNRQAAFDRAFDGAETLILDPVATIFEPAPPLPFASSERPVCSLADEAGEDMEIALLQEAGPDRLVLLARPPARRVRRIRLGRMWAEPAPLRLRDGLRPAWREDG